MSKNEKLPVFCRKCGGTVQESNNLRLVTLEYLSQLEISLGAPHIESCHLFPVPAPFGGLICEGSPIHIDLLNDPLRLSNRPISPSFIVRRDRWRAAYEASRKKLSDSKTPENTLSSAR